MSDRAAAPIIVTATFAGEDFAWLDGLRRAHFPAGRNHVPAHLTLFHHLPPAVAAELRRRLSEETMAQPPRATVVGVRNLGGGVAFQISSQELEEIRERLARSFSGLLIPQDLAAWRPHVTIQNKVAATDARALHMRLAESFAPRPLLIAGLASWEYRGGPWEPLSHHRFSRSARARRS